MTRRKPALTGTREPASGARRSPVLVTVQSERQFVAQVRRHVQARRTGKRNRPVTSVSFESVHALLKVLTPRRYALMEAVKAQGAFDSIEQLALAVARDRAAVSRDVKALTTAGLLQARMRRRPGMGDEPRLRRWRNGWWSGSGCSATPNPRHADINAAPYIEEGSRRGKPRRPPVRKTTSYGLEILQ